MRGRENKAADALSRITPTSSLSAISTVIPNWITEVQESYTEDEECKEMIARLSIDANAELGYTLKNGILRFHDKIVVGDSTALKQQLLTNFHTSSFGGHSGEQATYKRVKLIFHWKRMKRDVTEFVKHCAVCQKNKVEHTPYPGLLKPLKVPE